jgi:hypothetical protein
LAEYERKTLWGRFLSDLVILAPHCPGDHEADRNSDLFR